MAAHICPKIGPNLIPHMPTTTITTTTSTTTTTITKNLNDLKWDSLEQSKKGR